MADELPEAHLAGRLSGDHCLVMVFLVAADDDLYRRYTARLEQEAAGD